MWCTNCHAGSESAIFVDHCPQCGKTLMTGFKFIEKNPLPKKPSHSIRAMNKREGYQQSTKDSTTEDNSVEKEDVAQIMKDAKHRQ